MVTQEWAALSVKTVTGKPIKYIGMGEKLSDLEPFSQTEWLQEFLVWGCVKSH